MLLKILIRSQGWERGWRTCSKLGLSMNTPRYLEVLCWNLVIWHLMRIFLYLLTLMDQKRMLKFVCSFKDLTYFLKLNNSQRELMQYYLKEGSKGGKVCNMQSSNGRNQVGMVQCQWSLACWGTSSSLAKNLGNSNNIILVDRVDQLFGIDVKVWAYEKGL